jgi:hypothetical protein
MIDMLWLSLLIVGEFPRADLDVAADAAMRIKGRNRQIALAVGVGADGPRGEVQAFANERVFGCQVSRVLMVREINPQNEMHGPDQSRI